MSQLQISSNSQVPIGFFLGGWGYAPFENEDVTITVKGFKDLYSSLMAIEQWRCFSVPHLLWHGTSVNNGHLQEYVTLKPVVERLAVEILLLVLTI